MSAQRRIKNTTDRRFPPSGKIYPLALQIWSICCSGVSAERKTEPVVLEPMLVVRQSN